MMDIDPIWFLLSLLIGGIGFVAFMYGKKQKRLPQMAAGVVLLVYPYFVSNVWIMLGIAAAVLVAMFAAIRVGW